MEGYLAGKSCDLGGLAFRRGRWVVKRREWLGVCRMAYHQQQQEEEEEEEEEKMMARLGRASSGCDLV
jgi:hypothetical protein